MSMNQNTVVDYEAMADERATRDGRARAGRGPGSYARLALLLIGLELLILVVALIVQAAVGATP